MWCDPQMRDLIPEFCFLVTDPSTFLAIHQVDGLVDFYEQHVPVKARVRKRCHVPVKAT